MSLARIIQEAQQALESHQPPPVDLVEQAKSYFGDVAWREADDWHATGRLPESVRGLEIIAIDVVLDEQF
jgi:hypothetical protein